MVLDQMRRYDITPDRVGNMDQTAIPFDLTPRTSVVGKGVKSVNAKKNAVTGGTPGKTVAKELAKVTKDANGKFFATVEKKAWCDEAQMEFWIEHIWAPFALSKKDEGLTMLLLDAYSVPRMEPIVRRINKANTIVAPCDVGVNKPFKDRITVATIKSTFIKIYGQTFAEFILIIIPFEILETIIRPVY
ncbi:hypothetical protein HK101_008296 [Irineochytrium annulatum]|nr:hypothetical protein HK101_008296 [Irineochytrium annulatum]